MRACVFACVHVRVFVCVCHDATSSTRRDGDGVDADLSCCFPGALVGLVHDADMMRDRVCVHSAPKDGPLGWNEAASPAAVGVAFRRIPRPAIGAG